MACTEENARLELDLTRRRWMEARELVMEDLR